MHLYKPRMSWVCLTGSLLTEQPNTRSLLAVCFQDTMRRALEENKISRRYKAESGYNPSLIPRLNLSLQRRIFHSISGALTI